MKASPPTINKKIKGVGVGTLADPLTRMGITLIALVITIIILLILAGITITLTIQENGILNYAKEAQVKTDKEIAEEKLELVLLDLQSKKYLDDTYNETDYIDKQIRENGMLVDGDIVLVDEWQFQIDRKILQIVSVSKRNTQNKSLIGEVSSLTTSGLHVISVNDETYTINAIVLNGNVTLDGKIPVNGAKLNNNIYEFGNEETDVATETENAKNMVVLKVNGDLKIEEGVTLTACKSSLGYGGPKGMFIYCTGTLTNNGTISMTARGAKAEGQNVYLWQNNDESYEYVPAVGADGGKSSTKYCNSSSSVGGVSGSNGGNRKTGGGGSGIVLSWTGVTLTSPRGGNGTSYSGGSGAGSYMRHGSGYTQPSLEIMQGSDIGGVGGRSYVYWDTSYDTISGGVGNPGGMGSRGDSTKQTASGTGGLLIIYSSKLENNNEITAKGVSGNLPAAGTYRHDYGGASGGGSINIFLKVDSNKIGTINADGGSSFAKGGKGCISIGNISTGSYVPSN